MLVGAQITFGNWMSGFLKWKFVVLKPTKAIFSDWCFSDCLDKICLESRVSSYIVSESGVFAFSLLLKEMLQRERWFLLLILTIKVIVAGLVVGLISRSIGSSIGSALAGEASASSRNRSESWCMSSSAKLLLEKDSPIEKRVRFLRHIAKQRNELFFRTSETTFGAFIGWSGIEE